ncbi:MAG: rod shape-determining protein MreC [Streptococcaceae bacterium]|nr:rod shape-determining protein MreC [Streptococcaceae bacterium]
MKKFNPNKKIIVAIILFIIIVAIVGFTAGKLKNQEKVSSATSITNDSVGLVDKMLAAPAKFFANSVEAFENLMSTYKENQALKKKLKSYDEAIIKSDNLQKEIDALKSEIDLNSTLTSYSHISANVITRSPNTWQDMLIIDRGTKDGIEVNMAVMSAKGLVGRVTQVNHTTSKVELLTSTNQSVNRFPVKISADGGDLYGLLQGYDEKKQAFVVAQVTEGESFKAGDIVQTSGLGGNSPANLLVGKVISEKKNGQSTGREVYVKPATQMYDIQLVTVIKRLAVDGE